MNEIIAALVGVALTQGLIMLGIYLNDRRVK